MIEADEIREWQLWMHPYPTLMKMSGKKVNPKYHKMMRRLEDGGLIDLLGLIEARQRTPVQLKRCVRAVAKEYGGDVSKAFAICTAQLQKSGYLKVGTQEPTKKGKRAGRSKAAEKEHMDKLSDYEALLALARKED